MSLHGGHGSLAPSGPAIGSADCSVSGDMDHTRGAISGGQCPSEEVLPWMVPFTTRDVTFVEFPKHLDSFKRKWLCSHAIFSMMSTFDDVYSSPLAMAGMVSGLEKGSKT